MTNKKKSHSAKKQPSSSSKAPAQARHSTKTNGTSKPQHHHHHPTPSPLPSSAVTNASQPSTSSNLPPARRISRAERNAWNLKVLRRHDPCIQRILNHVPYVALYTFNHTHAHDPDGGKGKKYEGTWEKTSVEGTTFLVERSEVPVYGFFILNRGDISSVFQMFHEDDTIELGADPRYLTFRPGLWDRVYTPYDPHQAYTKTEKRSLICLWMSDDRSGQTLALYMTKTKELLERQSRRTSSGMIAGDSPPLTPLSELYHRFGDEDESHSFEEMSPEVPNSLGQHTDGSNGGALDGLFAGLGQRSRDASTSAPTSRTTSTESEKLEDSAVAATVRPPIVALPAESASQDTQSDKDSLATVPARLRHLFASNSPSSSAKSSPSPAAALNIPSGRPSPQQEIPLLDRLFASSTASQTSSPSIIPPPTTFDTPSTPPPKHRLAPIQTPSNGPSTPTSSSNNVSLRAASDESEGDGDDDQDFQELQAPSPSKLPAPLHTPGPLPVFDSGSSKRKKAGRKGATRAPIPLILDKSDSLHEATYADSPPPKKNRVATAHRSQKSYVPERMAPAKSSLEPESVVASVLASDLTSNTVFGRDADAIANPSSAVSVPTKYDFITGLLTLIHNDDSFVNDLYERYKLSINAPPSPVPASL